MEALSSSASVGCAHSLSTIEGDIVYRFLITPLKNSSLHVCSDVMENIKLFTKHKQGGINLIIFALNRDAHNTETTFLNIIKSFRKEVSEISALVIVDHESSQGNLKESKNIARDILNFAKLGVYEYDGRKMPEHFKTRVSQCFETLYFMQIFDKTEGCSAFNCGNELNSPYMLK